MVWTLLWLGFLDGAVNHFTVILPNHSVSQYFNYGRSVEGKLRQSLRDQNDQPNGVIRSGWLAPQLPQTEAQPTRPGPGQRHLVAFYGMSFTQQIAESLQKQSPELATRLVGAPSAPPNYVYAAYSRDRPAHKADVVVLGVLAENLKAMRSLSAATWQFEAPVPYTYPRYHLDNGRLVATEPAIQSFEQFRQALGSASQNPEPWQQYRASLAERDSYYQRFLFEANGLDNSTLVRLVRRALAQQWQRSRAAQVYRAKEGFIDPDTNATLKQMVKEFAQTARADGRLPIVLLIDSRTYGNAQGSALMNLLGPTLNADQIPHLSTHAIAPAHEPQHFVGDGHFQPPVNEAIARELIRLIDHGDPKRPRP